MVLVTRRNGTHEASGPLALARIFAEAHVPYAIIGGVALQVHQAEPRTTLDIDVAVATYGQLPRAQLEEAGFTWSGRFSHSENWVGPEGTPVQFTDDPALADAITRAEDVALEDVHLRVIGRMICCTKSSVPRLIQRAVARSVCRILPMRKPFWNPLLRCCTNSAWPSALYLTSYRSNSCPL